MGVQQSSLVASELQNHTLAELLENDELLKGLGVETARLSRKSRANLQNLVGSTRRTLHNTSRLQSAKLKPLLRVRESDVKLSPSLDLDLSDSKRNWTRLFWDDLDAPAFKATESKASELLWAYNHIFSLEKKNPLDRIRWRFYTMFFYDLHCLVNEKINLTSRAVNSIIVAMDTSGKHFDEINANIRSWIAKGHRYRNISKTLGGSGCLFLLPESISDYLWEESLPLNGPTHVEAMNRLRSLGIVDKAIELGVDDLACEIEQGLLEAFKQNILPDHLQSGSMASYSGFPYERQRLLPLHEQMQTMDRFRHHEDVTAAPSSTTDAHIPHLSVVSPTGLAPWLPNNGYDMYDASLATHMLEMKNDTLPFDTLCRVSEQFWL